jgi:hypothetical protein
MTVSINASWLFHGGAHHRKRKPSANGIAKMRKNGRRRPHRVRTRSLNVPTNGSLMASHRMPANAANEASRGSSPTTSVRKMA